MLWAPACRDRSSTEKVAGNIGTAATLQSDLGAAASLARRHDAGLSRSRRLSRLFVQPISCRPPRRRHRGAASPFFSPDGQWIAFFAGGKLKKVSVTGGAAVNLCDAQSGRGGTWADDDTIIFSPSSQGNNTLLRVPAAGGTSSDMSRTA
jgi:hypothetical protein